VVPEGQAPTPEELARHRETVRRLTAQGEALSLESPHATVHIPEWFTDDEPTPARVELQERLLAELRRENAGVAKERQAIVLAGPPGAGKSTVKDALIAGEEGRWRSVDVDDLKARLIKSARDDGTLESHIKPDAVKALEVEGEQFSPMELSALAHREAQRLGDLVRQRAMRDGDNLVIDTVLGWEGQAKRLSSELTAAKASAARTPTRSPCATPRASSPASDSSTSSHAGTTRPTGGRHTPSTTA